MNEDNEQARLLEAGLQKSEKLSFLQSTKGKTIIGLLSVFAVIGTVAIISTGTRGSSNAKNGVEQNELLMASAPPYFTPKIPLSNRLREGQELTQDMIDELEKEFSASADDSGSHTFLEGTMNPGDVVLRNYKRRENFSNVAQPNKTVEVSGSFISYVALIDRWNDGTGANFVVESGGVGSDHVTVMILPKYYRGYNNDLDMENKTLVSLHSALFELHQRWKCGGGINAGKSNVAATWLTVSTIFLVACKLIDFI